MKTDISGRRKVEPIFNIFPPSSLSEFDVHRRHLAKPETLLFFTTSPWYKTFVEVKHIFINRRDVCPVSFTSCQLYIHLHPLAKTCLHPAADRLSAVQSPVESWWVRSTPWKHLYLINLHKTGAFLILDFPEVRCDNSWFTTAARASLRKPFLPSQTMPRLNFTLMSPGRLQFHAFRAGSTLGEDFPSSTRRDHPSSCER